MRTLNTEKSHYLFLTLAAVAAFFLYSYLAIYAGSSQNTILNSPDETANFFFMKRVSEGESIPVSELLNEGIDPIVKPRSVNVHENQLVPGGFLGMILIFGNLGRVTSAAFLWYLTPLITVISAFFFYGLLKRFFSRQIAFLSSIFFLLHPAVWYYSARGFFPNMLFADLLIIGLYFLFRTSTREQDNIRTGFWIVLSAIFIGLAITVRPSEMAWIFIFLLLYALFHRKNISLRQAALFCFIMAVTFLPTLYYNHQIYGSVFKSGYLASNSVEFLPNSFFAASTSLPVSLFASFFIPFGVQFGLLFQNVYHFFFSLFWYLSIPSLLGFLWCVKKYRKDREKKWYMIFFFFLFIFYAFYYGSWQVSDNISQTVTIGVSYVRYWLPIFIISLPFIALFLDFLSSQIRSKKNKFIFLFSYFFVFVFFSSSIAFSGTEESLLSVKKTLARYQTIASEVFQRVSPEGVIIAERSDKIFFPNRRVIDFHTPDIPVFENLPMIFARAPIYYFTTLDEKEIAYLNSRKLPGKFSFVFDSKILQEYYLYQLKKDNDAQSSEIIKTEERSLTIKNHLPVSNNTAAEEKKDSPTAPLEKLASGNTKSLKENSKTVSQEARLDVPFLVQAPFANWSLPYQEACEEASMIMAGYYFQNKETPSKEKADEEILKLIEFEKEYFGFYEDTTAEQTAELLERYYGLETELKENFISDDIESAIDQGQLVIIPAYGKILPNPYFRNGGPLYHMFVVIGYNREKQEFITNDPGTSRGKGFVYRYQDVLNAAHDWNRGDVESGRKVMIRVWK